MSVWKRHWVSVSSKSSGQFSIHLRVLLFRILYFCFWIGLFIYRTSSFHFSRIGFSRSWCRLVRVKEEAGGVEMFDLVSREETCNYTFLCVLIQARMQMTTQFFPPYLRDGGDQTKLNLLCELV